MTAQGQGSKGCLVKAAVTAQARKGDLPLRASQVYKAEFAPGDVLRLQIGGLDDDTHNQVASGRLLVHLR